MPVSTIAFGTDYGTLTSTARPCRCRWTGRRCSSIADQTGGSYSEAATAQELEQVYADLGSQIGYTTEPKDISSLVRARPACCSRCSAPSLSLLWTNRPCV